MKFDCTTTTVAAGCKPTTVVKTLLCPEILLQRINNRIRVAFAIFRVGQIHDMQNATQLVNWIH